MSYLPSSLGLLASWLLLLPLLVALLLIPLQWLLHAPRSPPPSVPLPRPNGCLYNPNKKRALSTVYSPQSLPH